VPPAPAAGAGFSAQNIASILGNLAPQNPVSVNEVIRPETTAPVVDEAMEQQLKEHLPGSGETAVGTLSTPQLQQAATDAAAAANADSAMDVEEKKEDKMDES